MNSDLCVSLVSRTDSAGAAVYFGYGSPSIGLLTACTEQIGAL